jgi:hypothetical protein
MSGGVLPNHDDRTLAQQAETQVVQLEAANERLQQEAGILQQRLRELEVQVAGLQDVEEVTHAAMRSLEATLARIEKVAVVTSSGTIRTRSPIPQGPRRTSASGCVPPPASRCLGDRSLRLHGAHGSIAHGCWYPLCKEDTCTVLRCTPAAPSPRARPRDCPLEQAVAWRVGSVYFVGGAVCCDQRGLGHRASCISTQYSSRTMYADNQKMHSSMARNS